ncbi:Aminomethyltransferase [Candidatus Entotheonellaceae bacterium PAL068K]
MKRTPLYAVHRQLGARMVHFGGWEMPVFYKGIIEEHRRVRTHAGLFDVSHMGEIDIRGPRAADAVQYLTINDVRPLEVHHLQYSAMCNEHGGIIDDLTVCRLAPDHFLLVVNAGNIDTDFRWILRHLGGRVEARNLSHAKALLALQGPDAEAILQRLTPADISQLAYYQALPTTLDGYEVLVCRLGYTGEDGFEVLMDAHQAPVVWETIMTAGRDFHLLPVGLGARDTLRLEARYLLYGTDMDETTNPFEVGLGWLAKLEKGDFIGRQALQRLQAEGIQRRLAGFVMQARGVPRAPYPVVQDGHPIGKVTSGTMSPTLGQAIGTALVQRAHAKTGTEFAIEIRHQAVPARVVPPPFVPRRVKR